MGCSQTQVATALRTTDEARACKQTMLGLVKQLKLETGSPLVHPVQSSGYSSLMLLINFWELPSQRLKYLPARFKRAFPGFSGLVIRMFSSATYRVLVSSTLLSH